MRRITVIRGKERPEELLVNGLSFTISVGRLIALMDVIAGTVLVVCVPSPTVEKMLVRVAPLVVEGLPVWVGEAEFRRDDV